MKKNSVRFVKIILLVVGAVLLSWLMRKLGFREIIAGFQLLGWRLFVPIIILFPCYILYTLAWELFLKRFEHYKIPFWDLFRIKVAGEAANALTPLNFAGGDPMRIWLLSRKCEVAVSGASVAIDRTLQILALIGLIITGNIAALFVLQIPVEARMALSFIVFLLLLFIFFVIRYQTKGLFQKIFFLGKKFGLKFFSPGRLAKMVEIDSHIIMFYRQNSHYFLLSLFLIYLSRLIGVSEIYFLAHFLGVPMKIQEALLFATVIPITSMVGVVVPGALGVLEGVLSSLFYALHWNPANALVLQFARRFRSLFWILVGLVFMAIFKANESASSKQKIVNER